MSDELKRLGIVASDVMGPLDRINGLTAKLTEALAREAALREQLSALVIAVDTNVNLPEAMGDANNALADTDAAARAHDERIAAEAVLPWQMAVHTEARDYHQEANMPDTCRPEQVKNIFEDAREDARRRALEDVLVCLAPLMAKGST